MSRLPRRDPSMYGDHPCHVCQKPARYIHDNKHWCREDLDKYQYPHLAHLTQEERDANRVAASKSGGKMTMINTNNLTK